MSKKSKEAIYVEKMSRFRIWKQKNRLEMSAGPIVEIFFLKMIDLVLKMTGFASWSFYTNIFIQQFYTNLGVRPIFFGGFHFKAQALNIFSKEQIQNTA